MTIGNDYLIFWDKETKLIQNDYTVRVDRKANYDFSDKVEYFTSDNLNEIIDKIIELDLLTPDEI